MSSQSAPPLIDMRWFDTEIACRAAGETAADDLFGPLLLDDKTATVTWGCQPAADNTEAGASEGEN